MRRTKDEERREFAARLNKAYALTGGPEYGKYSILAREFNVTPHAVKRWFIGETIPVSRINAIANHLRVRAEWLLSNKGPMTEVSATDPAGESLAVELHRVPVVEPEHYEEWLAGEFSVQSHVIAQGKISLNSFAFELQDNSAFPRAMRGLMAVVDPADADSNGKTEGDKLVVIYDRGAYLLGHLIRHGSPTLEPENTDYKPVELSENYRVVGALSKIAERTF